MQIEKPATAKRCFYITPIGEEKSEERRHSDWVFNFAVKPVFEESGYITRRADRMPDPSMINDAVFSEITEADVCVADLSYLNPNVFYELGIRHAVQKPVIHIAKRDTIIPFDTQGYRAIFFDLTDYQSMEILKRDVTAQLKTIETPEFKVSNPLTQARGRHALEISSDSRDQVIADLQHRLDSLESKRLDSIEFGGGPVGPSRLAQIRAERIDTAIRLARRGRPPTIRSDYLTKLVEALAPFAPFTEAEREEILAAGYLSTEEFEKVNAQTSGARDRLT